MKSQRLPDSEFAIMDVIWDNEPPITTPFIMKVLGHERGWKIQTVVTLMGRLMERGFLRSERGPGRENFYTPLLSRADYLTLEVQHLMERNHFSSPLSLLMALNDQRYSDQELADFSKWLDEEKAKHH